MKLLQLRYLIAVADNGLNITTAANKLYISQPGISKQIGMLEMELGVRLFQRHGRSLSAVTPAGKQIIGRARLIMREVDNMLALARGFIDDEQADPDEAVNNERPMVAGREPSTRRVTRALRRRPF